MEKELEELEEFVVTKIQIIKKKYANVGKYKRKSIPKSVKDNVWNTYIGKTRGVGQCYCCRGNIDSKNFDCGHIVAAAMGGENITENLRPVCATCNKSMGVQNMDDFKSTYFGDTKDFCCIM
jgi:hypothetical protein